MALDLPENPFVLSLTALEFLVAQEEYETDLLQTDISSDLESNSERVFQGLLEVLDEVTIKRC